MAYYRRKKHKHRVIMGVPAPGWWALAEVIADRYLEFQNIDYHESIMRAVMSDPRVRKHPEIRVWHAKAAWEVATRAMFAKRGKGQ